MILGIVVIICSFQMLSGSHNTPNIHALGRLSKAYVTFKFPTMRTAFDMEMIIRGTPRVRGTLGGTGVDMID
jgi:hypothetical protein